MKKVIILLLLIASTTGYSQSGSFGNWIMYFGQTPLSEKFSLHSEIQYRNHDFLLNDIEQLLIRGGLNYHFSKNIMFTVGYAYIPSYRLEDKLASAFSEEDRIWQQIIGKNNFNLFSLEHRLRLEQRWIGSTYKGRFRYRLLASIPFSINNKKKYSINFYDEIFLNTKRDETFDRNRFYTALGYKLNSKQSIQLGFLNQTLKNSNKWYFQVGVFLNGLRIKKKEEEVKG